MTPDAFRAWRAAQGLSQLQAARALGITKRMIQLYEKGEKPEPGTAGVSVRDVEIPRSIALACAAIAAGLKPL